MKLDLTSGGQSTKVRFIEEIDDQIEPTMNKESILETIKKSQNKTRRILDEFLKPKLRTAGAKIASINLGHRGKTALAESIDLSKVQQIEPATTSTRS